MTPTQSWPLLLAHQTKISGEVGGTHHIEPNDTPRAGETVTTWFALVQAGGLPIPLQDCDCTLALYQSGSGTEVAIATPPLRAINVEGQTNVPATDIVFPEVGAYELVISGGPKGNADFSAFELRFPITVAAGEAEPPKTAEPSDKPSETAEPSATEEADAIASPTTADGSSEVLADQGFSAVPIGIGVGILAIAALLFAVIRRQQ